MYLYKGNQEFKIAGELNTGSTDAPSNVIQRAS